MAGKTEAVYPLGTLAESSVLSMETGIELMSSLKVSGATGTSPTKTIDGDDTPGSSPQRKGVGLFALGTSPHENGLTRSEIKDPKVQFVAPTSEEFDLLLRQMRERLDNGQGETIYELGIGGGGSSNGLSEDQLASSLATLQSLAVACEGDLRELRRKPAEVGTTAECLVRRIVGENDFLEVRVAVVGNVDAGKSTLLGVLTHGELDNGRGTARQRLFRHKHEMETGRTSSVGNDILGFDRDGRVVNKTDGHGGLDWAHICRSSTKVVTFIDLAGHEKYLKTTIFGMTGHAPDFCMLMVGSNAGVIGMTKALSLVPTRAVVFSYHQLCVSCLYLSLWIIRMASSTGYNKHLGLALALSVPVFVVVTKIDMCPPNVLQETMRLLSRVLKSPGCRKIPVLVQTEDDVITSAANFTSERICPIFQVSNVTGTNLHLLRAFLNLLSGRMHCHGDKPPEFQIDETYSVPGVGTVVSGTCMQGMVRLNDMLLLGPTSVGEFIPVTIRGIQRKRLPVEMVRGGQTASFALKKVKRSQIRKGMVMVHPSVEPVACWEFDGDILVLHHPTTISTKYQAMVHCGSTRQTASIISMNRDHLRTGDKASCRFRFIKNPEFIRPDTRMVFREGRTKAVGSITKIHPYIPGSSSSSSKQKSSHHHHHHHHHGSGHGRSKGRRGRSKRDGNAATSASITVVPKLPSPLATSVSENSLTISAAETSR